MGTCLRQSGPFEGLRADSLACFASRKKRRGINVLEGEKEERKEKRETESEDGEREKKGRERERERDLRGISLS